MVNSNLTQRIASHRSVDYVFREKVINDREKDVKYINMLCGKTQSSFLGVCHDTVKNG
jgi:hypothetical protein